MSQTSAPIAITDGLMIGGIVMGGRLPVSQDSIQSALAADTWKAPKLGELVLGPDAKTHSWEAGKANKDGWFEGDALDGGYFFTTYNSPSRQVMILNAQGQSVSYVNGVPRTGDPYQFGYVKSPVVVESGANELLFACGRGRLKVALESPRKPVYLDGSDATLPDVILSNTVYRGAVLLVNATEKTIPAPALRVRDAREKSGWALFKLRPVLPLSTTKVAFGFNVPDLRQSAVHIELLNPDGKTAADSLDLKLEVKSPFQTHKVTFLSQIDGSIQYYGVNPAQKPDPTNMLVLSLHGASVEGVGQAAAYGPKDWATIVAPTNRRPYGFDWEDWGRLDAMEVLAEAGKTIPHDPRRTVLTGHSMGGHGTWQIGTTFPDRFAAIGPSAGWISFASYGGGYKLGDNPTPVENMMLQATNASNTLNQVHNLAPLGVYILHGDKDDNVPVTEARTMRDTLATFHHAYTLFEQPGAGHWWSNTDEPGAACVDWAPMFDMFASRRIPAMSEVRDIEFHTASPNISARDQWLTIYEQQKQFEPSSSTIHLDRNLRRFKGTTRNVQMLTLNVAGALSDGKSAVSVELDGDVLKDLHAVDGQVWLAHDASWHAASANDLPGATRSPNKNPERGSGFKNALRHNFVIVYGTQGTVAENAWMLNKARFDAETFWYRGNASVPVIPDSEFKIEMVAKRDVLLIGNSAINSVWTKLQGDSPVNVSPGRVFVGGKEFDGDNLTCLFCRPSIGANTMVAFVGVTGKRGMRVAERLPYFSSGVAYPDYTVIPSEALFTGAKGILAAGYFDNGWKLPVSN